MKTTLIEPVTVLSFNEPEHAEPLRARLVEAGIRAEVYDERNLQRYWFMSPSLAGIRLRVDKPEYERALQLLRSWDATERALRQAIHCPECGSSRVEYPQFTRKFALPAVYAWLSALGFFQKKFYCEDCHHTWPVEVRVERETDALGWPKK